MPSSESTKHTLRGVFRFQLQFSTNRIKIGPLEPEIQPEKCALRHYAGPMTSHDFIGLPPVTISLVTLDYCFFTVEDYTKDTQEISCGQLPHRRRERRMFVIYSSAHQLCFIANYLGTWLTTVIPQSRLHLLTDFHDSRINVNVRTPDTALVKQKILKIYLKIFKWRFFK